MVTLGESLDHACARNIAHETDQELKQMAILFFTFQIIKKPSLFGLPDTLAPDG